jgi:hypothetical protein
VVFLASPNFAIRDISSKGKEHAMTQKVIENERTAVAQKVARQPDAPGKRIGKKGETSGIGKVAPGRAKLFRERLPQILAEAGYWEPRVGTVRDFRVTLIDNDTRMLFTIVYEVTSSLISKIS